MRKLIFLLLLFSSLSFAEVRTYDNSYNDIRVGVTPIHEVLEKFGKPKKITEYNDNIHYLFSGVKVTALKSTGKVSTISIFQKSYVDPNGVQMGITKEKLESKFGVRIGREYFSDTANGIIYWLRGNRVNKIVLVRELKIN